MEKAQHISDQVFDHILNVMQPGVEEHEIAAEIDHHHRVLGAQGMSFDTIVAYGPNSARPHARPGRCPLRNGDCVILDFGCVWEGMVSDMTRTICVGPPPDLMLKVYNTVREAQQYAIDAVRSGVSAKAVDHAARNCIAKAGFRGQFAHSTGHGLGFEVHEWPRVSEKSKDHLPAGCAVTIEPGIYLDDQFGVRIEDAVWVGQDGASRLSSASRELFCL